MKLKINEQFFRFYKEEIRGNKGIPDNLMGDSDRSIR
jgi:hypothetical protein